MRILVASKFWYRRGGLERVMFDEVELLEQAGHELAHFSTTHPDNDASPWSRHFADYLELGSSGTLRSTERAVAAVRLFHNAQAAGKFDALLSEFRPDVVHVHGIHRQLSPSILFAAARRGVPVVQTVHDHQHLCPADVLLRGGSQACRPPRCSRLWYGPCVTNRCVKGSRLLSALSAAEVTFQRVRRSYERTVSRFISPSAYLAEMMRTAGWRLPIDVVPNSVTPPDGPREPSGYFLYAGRLSREKGVETALAAANDVGVRVVVAGEGDLEGVLRTEFPGAEFVGRVGQEEVTSLLLGATAALVPSLASENAPLSVLEAMAAGVPVVASGVGGIPEIVGDGADGILLPPGDRPAWRDALARLANDAELVRRLGDAGRRRATQEFSPESHLRLLLDCYERALSRKRRGDPGSLGIARRGVTG